MKRLIFISCGQQTPEKISLGHKTKEVINATPDFEAYFAQSVQSFDSLRDNIFEALSECSGAIIFIHSRGKALTLSGAEWGDRSSVWVNQEIAILGFRQYMESRELPILVFKDEKVKLEGAMTAFIANPYPIKDTPDMLKKVREWLEKNQFLPGLREAFSRKWEQLSDSTRRVLSCLFYEGGEKVNEEVIRECLKSKFNLPNNDATMAIQKARLDFHRTNLVKFERNKEAVYEFNIHPTWKYHLGEQ